MQEFGAELKAQREARGLSLEDLFERTRINPHFLQAIESGNFDVLPRVYVRLFLKQYAQEVGLDQPEILKQYESLVQPLEPAPQPEPVRSSAIGPLVAIASVLLLAVFFGIRLLTPNETPEESASILTPTEPPGPASSVSTQDKPTPPPQDKPAAETSTTTPPSKQADNPQPATSNKPDAKNQAQSDTLSGSQPQTISPSPANTTESLPPADNVSAQEEPQQTLATAEETVNLETQEDTTAAPASLPENSPSTPEGPEKVDRVVAAYSLTLSTPLGRQDSLLTLSARTLQRTHVSILSDGRKVFEDILSSGAEQSWNARNRFRIEVDDARALSLFLQGEPLQPIGKPGRKLRLFISRASIWVEEIEPIAPGTKP